jgi:hypothetical protein
MCSLCPIEAPVITQKNGDIVKAFWNKEILIKPYYSITGINRRRFYNQHFVYYTPLYLPVFLSLIVRFSAPEPIQQHGFSINPMNAFINDN